ncbi:MAG TPA: hypothetical protein DCE44_25445 [Verrucomicrobiales bacterium]|nr:hypothetical protein [Verrucomicrobiales bacterium]
MGNNLEAPSVASSRAHLRRPKPSGAPSLNPHSGGEFASEGEDWRALPSPISEFGLKPIPRPNRGVIGKARKETRWPILFRLTFR